MTEAGAAAPRLTYGRILRFFLPLNFTFLVMSGATPLINAAIAYMSYGLGGGLAAYTAAFAVFVLLHSPLFMMRDAATRFGPGEAGASRVVAVGLAASLALTALDLALYASGGAAGLFRWLKTPESVVPLAEEAFLVFCFSPVLIALRQIFQGLLISRQRTPVVAQGVIARFGLLALFMFFLYRFAGMNPAAAGALGLNLGMFSEGLYMAAALYRQRGRYPEKPGVTAAAVARFSLPLFLANALRMAGSPLLVAIAQGVPEAFSVSAAEAFGVVRSLMMLFTSSTMGFLSMCLVLVHSRRDFARVWRFAVVFCLGLCGLFALLAFTPLGDLVLGDLMRLKKEPQALAFARQCLYPVIVVPLLGGASMLVRGLLMRSNRTEWVTLGSVGYLAVAWAGLWLLGGAGTANGALLGIGCFLAATTVQTALMAIGLRPWPLKAAAS